MAETGRRLTDVLVAHALCLNVARSTEDHVSHLSRGIVGRCRTHLYLRPFALRWVADVAYLGFRRTLNVQSALHDLSPHCFNGVANGSQ